MYVLDQTAQTCRLSGACCSKYVRSQLFKLSCYMKKGAYWLKDEFKIIKLKVYLL